jgi:TRAP-type C4-dicarboxylate transport system substrate-binding protein
LPFLWQDYEHVHRVLDGRVGRVLEEDLDKAGFKVLAWMDSWGYRNLVARKPVAAPSDLKGLKIRTIPTPLYIATLNTMGCNATPMPFGEVYSSMQTGVLDGFEHSAAMIATGSTK